jgi:hypothetical protein
MAKLFDIYAANTAMVVSYTKADKQWEIQEMAGISQTYLQGRLWQHWMGGGTEVSSTVI